MPGWSSRKSVAVAGGAAPPEPSLPPKYTEIKAVLEEEVQVGRLVNVIGVVKDCQLPMQTRGPDWKSTLTLYDLSTQDESNGIKFVIFRPEADMPQVTLGDIILLTNAKVQRHGAVLSLITHHSTSIRVYTASKIRAPPKSARGALAPAPKRDSHTPTAEENDYVAYLHQNTDKDVLPGEEEFQHRVAQSLNVKGKFSLLKDVQTGRFYDLVVRVARAPFSSFDWVSLYVSDYTENPEFHPNVWEGMLDGVVGGGDPYGYTSGSVDLPKKEWDGPYGKMSIQITCFDSHAAFVREEVKAGQWLALRNVQIRYGHDGRFLEGFMRGEREFNNSTKVNVHILDTDMADRETVDPNLKEAIRRQRDYEKKKKKQIKDIKSAQAAGLKRKASLSTEQGTRQPNARERRKAERAARKEAEEAENKENEERQNSAGPQLGFNDQVTCETHKVPYSNLESILNPPAYPNITALPFICAKYKTRVRVVDFFPPKLEEFASARTRPEYDMLSSDNDSDNDSDGDEAAPEGNRIWEWRFALQLEDATPSKNTKKSSPRHRIWALVDNTEAQCLTGLDATDLREDPETLSQLRERLFILWGNLEELKTQAAERRKEKGSPPNKKDKRRPGLEKPPLESSDAENEREVGDSRNAVSNKPFECCIRQYGVYEGEEDKGKWVRCFGLFGTKICY